MSGTKFPRTTVDGLSVSRMIIGSNWFLGWSHTSSAMDSYIKETIRTPEHIARMLEVFFQAGVDTLMGPLTQNPVSLEAVKIAEQRTGVKCILIDTPIIDVSTSEQSMSETKKLLDQVAANGADICLPHHSSVEQLVDKHAKRIHRLGEYTAMIRERGMIPGLSAHMPELVTYSDGNDEDVQTYIQIYNCAGFLMQLEVEWVHRIIWGAKKPVMTIKPMAAGRVSPFVGLSFVWNTIRDIDMVTVGCMTPREAAEDIEFSLAALERRPPDVGARSTPGKSTVMNRA